MMKVMIATKNQHKLVEFRRILEPLGYEMLSQSDVDLDLEVEETGTTFEENSMRKAEAIFQATGMITIADDSGLEVDALGGEPGIYSARYGGEQNKTDLDRCRYLLKKLDGIPKEKRTARFVSVISIVFDETDKRCYRGECGGWIGTELLGDNGFGYDPLFLIRDGVSFATISGTEKDRISHRGRALRKMEEDLSFK